MLLANPDSLVQSDADNLRVRAIWLYHVEGLTQNDVAQRLNLNRVMVVRLLADAKRRNEVRLTISAPLAGLVELGRTVEARLGIDRVILAPFDAANDDPVRVIAAAAGNYISGRMQSGLTVGVGWGRTLYNSLPFITGGTLDDFRVVSLLGGIAAARRFNPAEFAWQFAELFQGEGYLIPAPAVVDSPETKHALLERCGLSSIFEMADKLDVVLLSVGGISTLTTSYRTGHISEAERRSLIEAGAVGDVLYNFIDEAGDIVAHEVNDRVISANLARLRKTPERVLISGGREKVNALRGAIRTLSPTVFITDEITARALIA